MLIIIIMFINVNANYILKTHIINNIVIWEKGSKLLPRHIGNQVYCYNTYFTDISWTTFFS